jgi:hypothetical protein
MRIALLLALSVAACSSNGSNAPSTPTEPPPGPGPSTEPPPGPGPSTERPEMTAEACEAQGGTVVGDIGDGAIHRPDYRCPGGEPPIGTVPVGIEGSVCCAASASTCADGGWPQPKGEIAKGCEAIHGGCCYPDAASACAAAGCAADSCTVMESYPAQVSCR